ncbi:LacI family transcriptional regulator [Mycetocola tolaasinivorans]|uniref:LacI family transcriptional regulator n=1 Tax=Mycetocola tolaasinivorans TaxID=76635 RepID=A0A3L7A2I4_9MICO|nr:LacI family DNA-binding transcriptional regulator [Mycetocola tolaasinivorans]RLP74506.1 LacI family transcriptional regulator [Mycetocola tolaasinivorans]
MKKVSVHHVAADAGVSTATVSRALNDHPTVTAETRARVLASAKRLGYTPSFAARSLRSRRTGVLGLILPSLRNPFFPELIDHTTRAAERVGFGISLAVTENAEQHVLSMAGQGSVDGIILVGTDTDPEAPKRELPVPVPLVSIDRAPRGIATDVFQVDNAEGARSITEHLLALGHHRIGHISGPIGTEVGAARRGGYERALRSAGIPVDPTLIVPGAFSERSGFAATRILMARENPPTAIFAANDMTAIGCLSALRQQRAAGPVAVAGFDDIGLAGYVWPALTTYRQPIAELAVRSVERVLHGITVGTAIPRALARAPTLIPGILVVRESTLDPHHPLIPLPQGAS